MNTNLKLTTLAALAALIAVPSASFADGGHWQRRSDQKQQWQNLGIGAAVVGIAGLLTHNDTLTAVGAAGALYSGYRYEADGAGPYSRNQYSYDRGYQSDDRSYNDSRNVPIIGSDRYDFRPNRVQSDRNGPNSRNDQRGRRHAG